MSGLYGWKPTSAAKIYLDEADRRAAIEREAARTNERDQNSRDWLADYLSQTSRPTRFDWRPSIITEEKLEEVLHAEEAEVAFRRASQEAAEINLQADVGDAASEPDAPRLGEHGQAGGDDAGIVSDGGAEHDWISDPIPF